MRLRENLRSLVNASLFAPASVRCQALLLSALARVAGRRSVAVGSHAERIVIIKLDRIGDFVMVTPFLRELRRNFPKAWITLVVSDLVHPLAEHCPHVSEVLIAPRRAPGMRGIWRQWHDWITLAWGRLLPLRATLAILPRWDIDLYQSYALLAFTHARRRVSYSTQVSAEKAQRNRGADRLLTEAVQPTSTHHEVEKNLSLLRAIGLTVTRDQEELWPVADGEALLRRLLPDRAGHFLIGLCPCSAEAIKDWPLPRFLAVVKHFSHRPRVTFLLLVGPEYAALSTEPAVQALPNLVSLAGQLSLDETAALLGQCSLVLTVDTGLMHIASALQRPLVLVSGLSAEHEPNSHYSPTRFGPWQADCTLVAPLDPKTGPRRIDTVTLKQVVTAVASRLPPDSSMLASN